MLTSCRLSPEPQGMVPRLASALHPSKNLENGSTRGQLGWMRKRYFYREDYDDSIGFQVGCSTTKVQLLDDLNWLVVWNKPRAQHLPAGAAVPAERWGCRFSLSPWHWPWTLVRWMLVGWSPWFWLWWSLFPPLKVICFGTEQLATWSSTVDCWEGVQWHWLMRWWCVSFWFLPLPVEPWCSIMLCHRGQTLSNWSMLVVVCLRWMADLWKFPTFWPSEWTTSMPSCHLRLSSCMDRSKRRIIVLKLCWRPGSLTFGVCCPCVWKRKVNDGVGASHLVGASAVSGLLLCLFTGLWWLWCPTLFSWWWG